MSSEFLSLLSQQRPYFTNVPGTFVDATYKSRMPELVRDCVAMNRERFSEEQSKRLLKLADDMVNNVEIPLPSQFPEQAAKSTTSAEWEGWLAGKGYTWQNAPWFLSEHYMFHLILLLRNRYVHKRRESPQKRMHSETASSNVSRAGISLPVSPGISSNPILQLTTIAVLPCIKE